MSAGTLSFMSQISFIQTEAYYYKIKLFSVSQPKQDIMLHTGNTKMDLISRDNSVFSFVARDELRTGG